MKRPLQHLSIGAAMLALTSACGTTTGTGGEGTAESELEIDGSGRAPAQLSEDTLGSRSDLDPSRESAPAGTAPADNDDPPPAATEPAGETRVRRAEQANGPIEIGFAHPEGAEGIYESFGFEDVSAGDPKRNIEILVDYLNRTGGLAGREVAPVLAAINTNAASFESEYQAACARFTEDHDVFAVAASAQTPDNFRACLAEHDVPYVAASVSAADAEVYAAMPGYVQADNASLDRQARTLVAALADAGYFASATPAQSTAVGLLRLDQPSFERMTERALRPALSAQGVELVAEASFAPVDNAGGYGRLAAQINSAVLRFRSAGVTHVLIMEREGGLAWLFMNAAESQQYRPRYGLTSQNLLQGFLVSNVPAGQLVGSTAIGWWPVYDVGPADQGPMSPERRFCLDLLAAGGQDPDTATAEFIALNQCDSALLLRAAVNAAPSRKAFDTFVSGLDALGTAYTSPSTFTTRLGPGRHDGAEHYRLVQYEENCTCFRYRSPLLPFGN